MNFKISISDSWYYGNVDAVKSLYKPDCMKICILLNSLELFKIVWKIQVFLYAFFSYIDKLDIY